jgi:SAM-dependent methyltransferase
MQPKDDYATVLSELAETLGKGSRLGEIGGGANPLFDLEFVESHEFEYTVFDISQAELDKAPNGYKKVVADIASPTWDAGGDFDLVFSQMVAEHVADADAFLRNTRAMLAPGGRAVHLFPTLYYPWFVANRLLPERLAYELLIKITPHRVNSGSRGKFPAYYRGCRGPTRKQLQRYQQEGFVVERFIAMTGSRYTERVPVVRSLEAAFATWARRRRIAALTSYSIVVLKAV